MTNLEIKLQLSKSQPLIIASALEKYFVGLFRQVDTYYKCNDGRLKIRNENNKRSHAIYYRRNDDKNPKISKYHKYQIYNLSSFMDVFGSLLVKFATIEKSRQLYQYKNARVHIDYVDNLGVFVEIEVEIKNDDDKKKSVDLLNDILKMTKTTNSKRIACGYLELYLRNH